MVVVLLAPMLSSSESSVYFHLQWVLAIPLMCFLYGRLRTRASTLKGFQLFSPVAVAIWQPCTTSKEQTDKITNGCFIAKRVSVTLIGAGHTLLDYASSSAESASFHALRWREMQS